MTGAWVSVLFGLASAATWGAGDFFGGLATKRAGVYSVVMGSQVAGVAFLVVMARAFGEAPPPLTNWIWGGVAGLLGTVGLIALYHALATGRMGTAAPISAVVSASVPVVAGAILEGWPGAIKFAGFGLAITGVWLISRAGDAAFEWPGVGLPLLAGLGFGGFLVIISRASAEAVFWPLVAARIASLTVTAIVASLARQPILLERQVLPIASLAGVLDAGGNAFVVLAAHAGRLDVAGVLGSLYPASTIFLARFILKERFTRLQTVGIGTALAAIVLITL